jgi:hypothetical protein
VVCGNASFAVGDTKQSVSGYIVYLNGVPLLWGSLKQTIVVDSTGSAEVVAASIPCKQLLHHAENMLGFFGFSCPKPYRPYTDSMACFHIVTNPSKLVNVRHLQIRYHLPRPMHATSPLATYTCFSVSPKRWWVLGHQHILIISCLPVFYFKRVLPPISNAAIF